MISEDDAPPRRFAKPATAGLSRRAGAAPGAISLQWLLALLVLATALPLTALLAYHLRYEIAAEVDKADQLVQNLAVVTAADTSASLTEFRRLAAALAARPRVAALDPANCDPLAGELARLYRNLANVGTVNLDGQAICSVLTPQGGVMPNIGNPPWLQQLRRSDRFVVGAPQKGVYTGRPVVVLAYPLHGRDVRGAETVTGAVELVVNLAAFQPLVSTSLPAGGVAGIIDSQANLIARSIRPEEVVGRNFSGTEVNDLVLRQKSGTAAAVGRDGVERVYAFRPIADSGLVRGGRPADREHPCRRVPQRLEKRRARAGGAGRRGGAGVFGAPAHHRADAGAAPGGAAGRRRTARYARARKRPARGR